VFIDEGGRVGFTTSDVAGMFDKSAQWIIYRERTKFWSSGIDRLRNGYRVFYVDTIENMADDLLAAKLIDQPKWEEVYEKMERFRNA
jgi:hypothetical protein